MYRLSTLQKYNIRFMETPGASFQDGPFWFETLSSVKNISFLHVPLYYYRLHSGQSVCRGKAHFWRDAFVHIDKSLENIQKEFPEKYQKLFSIRLRRSLTTYAWGFSCLDTKGGMELREYIQSDY
jgi:hypothetical protein